MSNLLRASVALVAGVVVVAVVDRWWRRLEQRAEVWPDRVDWR